MQHARRRSVAPDRPPDLAAISARAADIGTQAQDHLARVAALLEAAEAGQPLPEWLGEGRLALLLHGLRQVGASQAMTAGELKRLSLEELLGDMERAAHETLGFRQGAAAVAGGRHRASRSRKPGAGQLSLIPGGRWKAPAVSGAAALAALRHVATAKGAAIAIPAAAAAAVVTIGTSGFTTLPDITQAPAASSASSLPVLAPADAIPLGSLPLPSYAGRHRKSQPSPDAKTATLAPPPVVIAAPSPMPPSAEPSAVAYGTVNLQTVRLAIGADGLGTISFSTSGGPVQWTASSSSPLAVSLSDDEHPDGASEVSGITAGGRSVVLHVTIAPGSAAGLATVTITAGGQQVTVPVTWLAVPGL